MDKLARLRLAEKRIVKYQRRVWLAQVLMWPMTIVGAVVAVGALVWFLRSRSVAGGMRCRICRERTRRAWWTHSQTARLRSSLADQPSSGATVFGSTCYQMRIQSTSIDTGKLVRAGSPPPGPPMARLNIGDNQ